VLLHGFPEFWYGWRHQIPALVVAGFRVLAPDMRGYNLSEKPPGVAAYAMAHLVADVVALIRHAGAERATVVGHDWGGMVAWGVARHAPEVLERLAVLNAPHPAAFLRLLRTPDQARRSSYMGFFQLPGLAERVLQAGNFALFERIFRNDPTRPGAFTDTDIARYKAALGQPGALTGGLNYYRAAARGGARRAGREIPPSLPTLLIWGEQDRHLGVPLAEESQREVPHLQLARLPQASHWVQHDAPEEVNRLLLEFLTHNGGT